MTEYAWNNSLRLRFRRRQTHPADAEIGRHQPAGYATLEITLYSLDVADRLESLQRDPWYVLSQGFRVPDQRGEPQSDPELARIREFLPMQVELGCGPSIEAGIPPLHTLHRTYAVSTPDNRFVLAAEQDTLAHSLVSDPIAFLRYAAGTWIACVKAQPTPFHRTLRRLRDSGLVVGPVITNNFDRLCSKVGLSEHYVRRFDEVVPPVTFAPEARSLLVVGSHADRRRVQRRAREAGLRVFLVDPEGYVESDGRFVQYRLEAPQDSDFHCQCSAAEVVPFLERLLDEYGGVQ